MGGIMSKDTICSILSYFGGEAKYIWGLKDNLDDLQTQKEKLTAKKKDLLNKVKLAEQRLQLRTRQTSTVEHWFKSVEKKEGEVVKLQQERDQEIDRLCLGGFCSKNLKSSYDFGKRVEDMKSKVIELKKEGEEINEPCEEVPECAAVVKAVDRTIVGQDLLVDQVWRYITDQEKNKGIIGLHGSEGVGKTTLLKQVNNKFCSDEHDFHVVIWSVVSRQPNLEQIQEDIRSRIGFSKESWKDKSFEARASDITNTLSRLKFVLLLDDICDSKPDLTYLGVPLQRLHFGSKIVFTTRCPGNCGEMGAEELLPVSHLTEDKAWELFQAVVTRPVLDKHPDIPKLARAKASKCRGLPQALKTAGQVMSSIEYPEEWSSLVETVISALASKFETISAEEWRSSMLRP